MITFLKCRGRALTVLFFAVLSFGAFLLFTTAACRLFNEWYGIIAGCLLMALALLCHHFGDQHFLFYVIAFLLNAVGMGCFASAYYNISGVSSTLPELAPALLLPVGLILMTCAVLTAFPRSKTVLTDIVAVLILGLMIATIVFWVRCGGAFYAFSLFSLLIAGFHLGVCMATANEAERSLLRDVSLGSFGMFLAVGVAALIAISCAGGDGCDCDCCDCGDCCGTGGDGKKKKQR